MKASCTHSFFILMLHQLHQTEAKRIMLQLKYQVYFVTYSLFFICELGWQWISSAGGLLLLNLHPHKI